MDYRKPTGAGAMPLRDLSANEVGTIFQRVITNNTPPAFASAEVDGAALTITFNGGLDAASVPAADAFTVTVEGDEVDLADSNPVAISGSTVTLTLAEPVAGSLLPVTVGYTAPATNPLRDADNAKNPVPDFAAQSVTNNTTDTTPPGIESVQITGRTLTITFNERLDENSVPGFGRFSIAFPGGALGATAVQVKSNVVTVTYGYSASALPGHGQTVKMDYRKPTGAGAMPLRDLSANEVGTIFQRVITNNTPPAFASAEVDGAALTITFNGGLDAASVPAADAFTVTVEGSAVDLADTNPVSISGSDRSAVPLAMGHDWTAPGAPHVPTGTAQSGPGVGEITLTWEPATSGPTDGIIGWYIYAEERSIGDVRMRYQTQQLPADARSFTLTGLNTGTTWTVGVGAARGAGGGVPFAGDIAQARLKADSGPETVTLTLAEPVGGSLLPVTVGYTAPDSNPLRDADNAKHPVPNFAAQSVTNNTSGDTTPPEMESLQANGRTLTITFNERLDENSVPTLSSLPIGFAGTSIQPASVQIDRNVVTLRLRPDFLPGHDQTMSLSYRKPTGQNAMPVRDLSGNEVADFSQQAVTNNTPPNFASAEVDGATLTITFNGGLDPASVPAADAFTVTVEGDTVDLADSATVVPLALGYDSTSPGVPNAPTGTATPGPGVGEITLTWEPANTGPSNIAGWQILAAERSTGNVTRVFDLVADPNVRSYTLTGLKTGVTWTVGVGAAVRAGVIGDVAQARLEAAEGPGLTVANPVSISDSDRSAVPLALGHDETATGAPHEPTGSAQSGPGIGEITLTWEPATTGPTDGIVGWFIYADERSTGNVRRLYQTQQLPPDARSFTLTGLKTGTTWTVGVGRRGARAGSPWQATSPRRS